MKNKTNIGFQLLSFLTCAVISAAFIIAFKYYITFSEETAGSYQVITIFGDSIKIFLIKILSVVASLLAFITFMIKSKEKYKERIIFPIYLFLFGILWMILPAVSAYTISRFTGLLIIQTVTSIAIISNTVFFMLSMCFAGISAIDLIYNIIMIPEKKKSANCLATAICGVPFGISLAILLSSILQASFGLNSVFILVGAIAVVIGVISTIFNPLKQHVSNSNISSL